MKLKRLSAIFSATVVAFSSLLSIGFMPFASAVVQNCSWTGASSLNFNTAGNWSNCGVGVPQAGDNLVFPNTSLVANATLNNDISGLSVGSIAFTGSNSGFYNFTINGNGITLASGVTTLSTTFPTLNVNLTLGASQSFTGAGGFSFGDSTHHPVLALGSNNLTIGTGSDTAGFQNTGGTITGSGALNLLAGTLTYLTYASTSSWTGTVTVNNNAGLGTSVGAFGSVSSVTVQSGGYVCLGGYNGADFTPNLTLAGDGFTAAPSCGMGGGSGYQASASINLTGNVTLTANTRVTTDGTVTVSGPLSGNFTIGMVDGQAGKLVISSSNNTSLTPNGNVSSNLQVTTVDSSDSQPNTPVAVAGNQEWDIDGVRGDTDVASGGILKGSGTVGQLLLESGSTVAPGHSPGCLNSGNLTETGTYQAEIGGTTACTGYDQLNVTGTVTLTDGGTPAALGTLAVSLYNGFKPAKGQKYTIINNDAADAVVGTFTGLAEGATFTVNGYVFAISYVGGDGNDVVLTVQNVPATPDTGFALVAAHPGATLMMTVLLAGTIFGIARRTQKATVRTRR